MTYLPGPENKRKLRKRKTREELEDLIVKYYRDLEAELYMKDVFQEWSDSKLRFGEIQPQSYDKYCNEYKRFFPKNAPISRKKFKNITYVDLEEHIKSSIHDKKLSRKAYTNMRTIIRGMFTFGKTRGYTELSMTQFFVGTHECHAQKGTQRELTS